MRVVVAEDEALLRQGLIHVVEHAGHEVVAAVGDGEQLIGEVERHQPDLVITDIRMPPSHTTEGLVAAVRISRQWPGIAVLVLSQHVQREYALELLAERSAGVGYLLKQRVADVATFQADLERVRAGGTVLDPEVVALMVTRARRRHTALDGLTSRQTEVLALMAQGRSNAAIARQLTITEKAVVGHVSRIYDELGLATDDDDHRRVLAVVRFLSREG
jgi:DNA-binding NarL/FixJ family response regulator